ncbi:hypothetical protein XACa0012 (plasmid) [Xanthomonas citri pv. citri str. 306]|uniref:Uncharacterized protein n=1 Tax=Xanthomonas axonopodis pv. citri (strain 306) TaxID=190486 RepID=A0AAI7ZJA8_XANAC|nr:hypothetical protein XACa0012 [Xanthomonas citri pv. citri str. 306]
MRDHGIDFGLYLAGGLWHYESSVKRVSSAASSGKETASTSAGTPTVSQARTSSFNSPVVAFLRTRKSSIARSACAPFWLRSISARRPTSSCRSAHASMLSRPDSRWLPRSRDLSRMYFDRCL